MRFAVDTTILTNTEKPVDADKFAKDMLPRVQMTGKVTTENIRNSQSENKRFYDRGTEEVSFEIGEKCWLRNMQKRIGQCPKMTKPYTGPYFIVQKRAKGSYKPRHAITDVPLANPVHVNRLKKYVGPYHEFCSKAEIAKKNTQNTSRVNPQKTKYHPDSGQFETRQNETSDSAQSPAQKEDEKMGDESNGWQEIDKLVQRRGSKNTIQSGGLMERKAGQNSTEFPL